MPDFDQVRVNVFVENQLDRLSLEIEGKMSADVMAMVGPMVAFVNWCNFQSP
jgi:hypothetical protein